MMRFSSGSWTLYYNFKPTVTRDESKKFKYNQFSNNHLLTQDSEINKLIMDTEREFKYLIFISLATMIILFIKGPLYRHPKTERF